MRKKNIVGYIHCASSENPKKILEEFWEGPLKTKKKAIEDAKKSLANGYYKRNQKVEIWALNLSQEGKVK